MDKQQKDLPQMTRVVERNVNALLHRKEEDHKKRTVSEKIVDAITSFMGSMPSVFFHLFLFGTWILWNSGFIGLKPFDPVFLILACFVGIEAIFLTIFVLMFQKRMNSQADKWAELDLQVSLLTEHELTRVLKLVRMVAQKMGIEDADSEENKELSKDIHPDKVLDTMENAGK